MQCCITPPLARPGVGFFVVSSSTKSFIPKPTNLKRRRTMENTAASNTFNEAQYAALKNTLPAEDYAVFIRFQKDKAQYEAFKTTERLTKRKKNAGQNFFVRRQALVLRWVNQEEIAPDTHVLAYDSVHNLKKNDHEAKGTYEDRMKISVADEEIYGFLALEDEGHWYEDITLKQVEEKAAAIKAAKDKAVKDKAKNKAKSENAVAGDHQASKSEDAGAEDGKVEGVKKIV